jgi:hypothetical protein
MGSLQPHAVGPQHPILAGSLVDLLVTDAAMAPYFSLTAW